MGLITSLLLNCLVLETKKGERISKNELILSGRVINRFSLPFHLPPVYSLSMIQGVNSHFCPQHCRGFLL